MQEIETTPLTVLSERRGTAAILSLCRPAALNALDLSMVRAITACLVEWSCDPSVTHVVLRGVSSPDRPPAFCAGGDIRFFHRAALAADPELDDFFTEEYALNYLIHNFPKPCIALMDGIVMGGGMGLSQGASLRVVTERSRLAMPETQIGLFPDVGGGCFLSRCPGAAGEYLAITGAISDAGEALTLGLADLYVPSARLENFIDSIVTATSEQALKQVAMEYAQESQPRGEIPFSAIDHHFLQGSLQAILASLAQDRGTFAQNALNAAKKCSPLMMAVALEQIHRSRGKSLKQCLLMERSLVHNCFYMRPAAASETVEGIRALVIDKDKAPRWTPASAQLVTDSMVSLYFDSPWADNEHPLGSRLPLERKERIKLLPCATSASATSTAEHSPD